MLPISKPEFNINRDLRFNINNYIKIVQKLFDNFPLETKYCYHENVFSIALNNYDRFLSYNTNASEHRLGTYIISQVSIFNHSCNYLLCMFTILLKC